MTEPGPSLPPTTHLVLGEALGRVRRALRQLARAQAAHRRERAEADRMGLDEAGRVPDAVTQLGVEVDDAMTFAISAARQAVFAHRLLEKLGLDGLPAIRQGDAVVYLRNLDEHWDEWVPGLYLGFAEDNRWLASHSGRKWHQETGGARPTGTKGYTNGPDTRLTMWNTIAVDDLTEDLAALRDAIAVAEQLAFEHEMPDEDTVLDEVGASMWMTIQLFTNVRLRPARDGVPRVQRSWLEWAVMAVNDNPSITVHDEAPPADR